MQQSTLQIKNIIAIMLFNLEFPVQPRILIFKIKSTDYFGILLGIFIKNWESHIKILNRISDTFIIFINLSWEY